MLMNAIGLSEFGGPEVLTTIELERPVPNENQVLIRVQGVSVNYADIQTRKGIFHGGGAVFPIVPGLDAMGIAETVGSHVTGIKKGQRVIAFPHTGTYSEYVLADGNLVFPVPDEISFEQATAFPLVSFTSYMLLNKVAKLQEGETILIHAAAGGIGTTAIQIAKSMGAGLIIGTVGKDEKIQQALEAGADVVICDKTKDFVAKVNEVTSGKGADVILDSLGGTHTNRGMDCLAYYGRMVVFGNAAGSYSDINTKLLHSSCRSILGYSSVTTRKMRPEWYEDTADAIIKLMVSGKLDMKVSQILSIEKAGKAHELMENSMVTGKIILKI
jgi:NADPH2:quinone reductase